jgi:hypothetical protein
LFKSLGPKSHLKLKANSFSCDPLKTLATPSQNKPKKSKNKLHTSIIKWYDRHRANITVAKRSSREVERSNLPNARPNPAVETLNSAAPILQLCILQQEAKPLPL